MKKMSTPTLATKRAEINARYSELKSWRKVAQRHYPEVKPGTLCAVAKGYQPRSSKVLAALGLLHWGLPSDPTFSSNWEVMARLKTFLGLCEPDSRT